MGSWFKSGFSALVLLFAVSSAYASSLFVPPSTKSTAMGYSFVAVADDVSAIFWNPAGLTQLEGSGYSIGSSFVMGTSRSNLPLNNSSTPNADNGDFPYLGMIYPTEPSQYASKDLKIDSILPFIAGYKKVKDLTLAYGVYAVGGGGGIYESRQMDSFGNNLLGSVNALQAFLVGNVSAAKDITNRLSVGVGLDLVYMIDQGEVKKQFTSASPAVASSYYQSIDQKASGTGLQANLGCLYKIIPEKLKFGLVLRSGTAINLKGTARFKLSGLSSLGFADTDSSTDYDEKYAYPLTASAGFSYKPSVPLTLSLSLIQENYSVLRNDFEFKDQTYFPNLKTPKNWKDNTMYCFGAEYKANEKLSWTGGIFLDPNQCPKDQITLLNPNQYQLIVPNIGIAYMLKGFKLEADYSYFISEGPSLDGRSHEFTGNTTVISLSHNF